MCHRSLTVGLVGAPPARQRLDYHAGEGEEHLLANTLAPLIDLRGRTNLIQLAGACRKAKAVVSVDAGPMHVAAGVGTPTLAIVGNDAEAVGASPIRLWLPRSFKSGTHHQPFQLQPLQRQPLPKRWLYCRQPSLHGRRGCPASDPLAGGNAGMNCWWSPTYIPPRSWAATDAPLLISSGACRNGPHIQVLSSDAPHLGASSGLGPSGEAVDGDCNSKEVTRVAFGRCKTRSNAKPLINPMPRSSDRGSTASTGMESCWAISTCSALSFWLRF